MFDRFLGRLMMCLLVVPATAAHALVVPFSASFSGQSDIVEVLDPIGPLVQVQSRATGLGVLGLVGYSSADQVNLGTGQGEGDNVFTAGDGSQLFGHFTVQLLPTRDPSLLSLIGVVDIVGGSGRFDGADGELTFSGDGQFVSPTQALMRFVFEGRVQVVDEPGGVMLVLLALLLGVATRRGRAGLRCLSPCAPSARPACVKAT